MTWVARTNGATSGQALELKDLPNGLLSIPNSDRANWRVLGTAAPPTFDRATHSIPAITATPIAANGTCAATWTVTAFDPAEQRRNLIGIAEEWARGLEATKTVEVSNRPTEVHDRARLKLLLAKNAIEGSSGSITAVRLVAADGSSVNANVGQIDTALAAIASYYQQIYTALDTIVAEIKAGTLTTTAAVQGHAAWPA